MMPRMIVCKQLGVFLTHDTWTTTPWDFALENVVTYEPRTVLPIPMKILVRALLEFSL